MIVVAWWPHGRPSVPLRARQYTNFTACLLTDSGGIAAPPAATVWAGMQDASTATRAKVQYLAVVGPQTQANAETFLTSLAQGRCNLILAAGPLATSVVRTGAPTYPGVRFVVVGSGASGSNVQYIGDVSGSTLQSQISTLVGTLAKGAIAD
jgi:basic membrane lipoprotein Med (substrate-binding protein (PBP1-ABC) superfamily)